MCAELTMVCRVAVAALLFLVASNAVFAETVTATCYSPEGKRFDFADGDKEETVDGFANSTPTFFFTTRDPNVLIESWQAALPFPELIKRESVDAIVPPSVTKAVVVFRSAAAIHAISMQGRHAYTTTLYLKEGIGIFTRVRVAVEDNPLARPMGAIFTAKCSFSVLE